MAIFVIFKCAIFSKNQHLKPSKWLKWQIWPSMQKSIGSAVCLQNNIKIWLTQFHVKLFKKSLTLVCLKSVWLFRKVPTKTGKGWPTKVVVGHPESSSIFLHLHLSSNEYLTCRIYKMHCMLLEVSSIPWVWHFSSQVV